MSRHTAPLVRAFDRVEETQVFLRDQHERVDEDEDEGQDVQMRHDRKQ